MSIKKLSIVCSMGAETYEVGGKIDNGLIAEIRISAIRFNGDPFDHYCGFDANGKMLFSVNCNAPTVVEFL